MIDYTLSLPGWLGAIVAMTLTTGSGLMVYGISHRFISLFQRHDLINPITSLFRMVGILVSLMLSLAFSEVVAEWRAVKNAIDREAVAISDLFFTLQLYDAEEAREGQAILIDYSQAIVDDDWPAMARDQFGQQATALVRAFSEWVLNLQSNNARQKDLKAYIEKDLDAMSDYRLIRLNHSLGKHPIYILVIVFGFLVSMACFGAYQPHGPLIILVSLYTAFIGLVLYLVMSLSDPFNGGNIIEPGVFEHLVEGMRSRVAK